MKSTQNFAILAVFIIGCVNCQSSNDLDVNDIQEKLHEHGLPDSINENVTQQVENVFKDKCEQQGAGDVVDSIKDQQNLLKECITEYVNVTVIEEELAHAKKSGSMDEVFGRYCKKWPNIYNCVENVTDLLRQCMNTEEKEAFNKSLGIANQLQEFMCFKDGDRLAMFVAEGGVECFDERQEEVKRCINTTIGDRLPTSTDGLSVANLPTFLFSERDCNDFDTIRICVNKELEKCKNSTPANLVDALFKFLKKHMPCKATAKSLSVTAAPGSSSMITWNFVLVVVLLPLQFLLKFRLY